MYIKIPQRKIIRQSHKFCWQTIARQVNSKLLHHHLHIHEKRDVYPPPTLFENRLNFFRFTSYKKKQVERRAVFTYWAAFLSMFQTKHLQYVNKFLANQVFDFANQVFDFDSILSSVCRKRFFK